MYITRFKPEDIVVTGQDKILYLVQFIRTHADGTLELWIVFDLDNRQQYQHWMRLRG